MIVDMENGKYNREDAEKQWNEFQEKIDGLKKRIDTAKEGIKVDVLGDLKKLENQEAELKHDFVKLNEGKEHWENIEESINYALIQLKTEYEKINSKCTEKKDTGFRS
jgi:chromosome segregation ATPase